MPGKIEIVARYTRQMLRDNPDKLFVFGDNMQRRGLGGQAKECRGEPNAVGIPTKWRPTMDKAAFFTDADLPAMMPVITAEFQKLAKHLQNGGTIVWPRDGVGTGLADLPRRAPAISIYIDQHLDILEGGV